MGDAACPAGPYNKKGVYHLNFDDQRDCSPCTCSQNLINAACSGGSAEFYTDHACTQGKTAAPLGVCLDQPDPTPASGVDTRGVLYTAGTITGTPECPSAGGDPVGQVDPTDPVTYCCL
jgi:hypothetical protein